MAMVMTPMFCDDASEKKKWDSKEKKMMETICHRDGRIEELERRCSQQSADITQSVARLYLQLLQTDSGVGHTWYTSLFRNPNLIKDTRGTEVITTGCLSWSENMPNCFCDRGSAQDPDRGAYSAPQTSQLDLMASFWQSVEGREEKEAE